VRRQLRVGSFLCWLLAWLLALGGALAYLLRPGDWMWLIGGALVLPVFVLAVWREERRGGGQGHTAGHDGPWAPP